MENKSTFTDFGQDIYPLEFITTTKTGENQANDSILLTTIEYLLSLNWPSPPSPPPEINLGSTMELFLRNIINKTNLNNNNNSYKELSCKLPQHLEQPIKKSSLDYNEFLKILQTVLTQSSTTLPTKDSSN